MQNRSHRHAQGLSHKTKERKTIDVIVCAMPDNTKDRTKKTKHIHHTPSVKPKQCLSTRHLPGYPNASHHPCAADPPARPHKILLSVVRCYLLLFVVQSSPFKFVDGFVLVNLAEETTSYLSMT